MRTRKSLGETLFCPRFPKGIWFYLLGNLGQIDVSPRKLREISSRDNPPPLPIAGPKRCDVQPVSPPSCQKLAGNFFTAQKYIFANFYNRHPGGPQMIAAANPRRRPATRKQSAKRPAVPQTLEEIFQPTTTCRLIQANRSAAGLSISFREIGGQDPIGEDRFAEMIRARSWMKDDIEIFEATKRGLSLLAASDPGDGETDGTYVIRWREHETGAAWVLITNCEQFWRSQLFTTGFAFRARVGRSFAVVEDQRSAVGPVVTIPPASIFC